MHQAIKRFQPETAIVQHQVNENFDRSEIAIYMLEQAAGGRVVTREQALQELLIGDLLEPALEMERGVRPSVLRGLLSSSEVIEIASPNMTGTGQKAARELRRG